MHRLVIALTSLLVMVGAVVVAAYLFIFAGSSDLAARAVPAGASVYATVYLEPSTGQKLNLATMLGRVPGFADQANLDVKIHQIAARFLGQAGVDYEADVRPWLGNQLSVAVSTDATADPGILVVVAVKDREEADAAVARLSAGAEATTTEDYQGTTLHIGAQSSWALTDDLLLVANGRDTLVSGIDSAAGRATSLDEDARFQAAMRRIPADHLAAMYADLRGMASQAELQDQVGGYSTLSVALVAEPGGLRLAGVAPFDASAAPSPAKAAFALASEPSSLTSWMPDDTQAEMVVFGLSQTLLAAQQQLDAVPGGSDVSDALDQLRAVAALGLGISLDDDILPLFDREVAVAASGLDGAVPSVQLLLRPSDAAAGAAALSRLAGALADRGAQVTTADADGVTITHVAIPDLGALSFTVSDDVIVAGLTDADVQAALAAHDGGTSLADTDRYLAAWDLAGQRAGNEGFIDGPTLSALVDQQVGLDDDARDILHAIDAVAFTAPAMEGRTEFHLVLTVR